jgi:hypothetical protein
MSKFVEYKETGNFVQAPVGQYQAVCTELLDWGESEKIYKNKDTGKDEPRLVWEVQYVFQLNQVDPETGKRYEVRSKKLNARTLGGESGLRKFLLAFRGHDLTEAELKPPGIDIEAVIGRNAIISVVHNQSGDKTYANIGSIMPIMQGMPEITALDYESKQAWVDQQKANPNGAAAQAAATPAAPNVSAVPDPAIGF